MLSASEVNVLGGSPTNWVGHSDKRGQSWGFAAMNNELTEWTANMTINSLEIFY